VLHAGHREQIVAIGCLPHVDEIDELFAVLPEVTGPDLDAPRRPVVRMAGDADRSLFPDRAQDVLRRLIGADEFGDVQRNDVRVLSAPQMILCDLGAGNDEQAVDPLRRCASARMSARYASKRSSVTEN